MGGLRQVEVKKLVALARPVGPDGKLTTIIFSGKGDLKVPRSIMPNWLISGLIKTIGRFIFQQALEHVAKFDTSDFGPRLRNSKFYADLNSRIASFIESKKGSAQSSQP